jgi:hypothetical protein
LYADSAAKEILDEITSLQDSDKKSPFDHTKIKQRTLEVSAETFDFEPYPWFSHTVCLGEGL